MKRLEAARGWLAVAVVVIGVLAAVAYWFYDLSGGGQIAVTCFVLGVAVGLAAPHIWRAWSHG